MKLKVPVFLFLILICLLFLSNGKTVLAVEVDEDKKARMEKGEVIYTTIDTQATSSIRWKTEGFTVKREKTNGNPTSKPKGEFMLSSGEKKNIEIGGKIITTFRFSEEKVRKEFDNAKVNHETLKKTGGYVYLNGIFRVYQNNVPISGYKKTLNAIKNAASWRNPDDFKDRFDIALKYEPEPQPVYLTIMKYNKKGYTLVERQKIADILERYSIETTFGEIEEGKIPATIEGEQGKLYLYRTHWAKWSDKEKSYSNGIYRKPHDIKKTTINPKLDWELYKNSLQALRNRTFDVVHGGIEIVCIYKNFSVLEEYFEEEKSVTIIEPEAKGIIQAEKYGEELFDSQNGIPVTEYQYVNVITEEYLTQYQFRNYTGTKFYMQKIKGQTNEDGTTQPDSYIPVARNYSYWKIEQLDVYKLSSAIVENETLPQNKIVLTPTSSYQAPNVSYKVHAVNMKEPISGEEVIGMIEVRNDSLTFNGVTIMDGDWTKTSTNIPSNIPISRKIDKTILYKSNLFIDKHKANGEYESIGTVIYERICHYGNTNKGTTLNYDIENINAVTIHTPVICDITMEDVKTYNQLIEPNQSIAGLVLDRNFHIQLPTIGYHCSKKGYEYNNYSKYTALREVKFPFDVYLEKTYYKANTWIPIYTETTCFYLPIWVKEGEYTIEARARTINCDSNNGISYVEELANTEYENYVASDTVDVEVSGRIYGLSLYDISDSLIWNGVFRKKDSLALTGFTYTVGDKNQNGVSLNKDNKYTIPIINGSHPTNSEVGLQKTGYVSRFYLTTVGNLYTDEDYIHIKPTFYHIDKDGNRQEVDLYYTETINGKRRILVKAGSQLDLSNKKTMSIGDSYTSVPLEEQKEKAYLEGKSLKEIQQMEYPIYTFTNIMISKGLRTFIGKDYTPTNRVPNEVDENIVEKSMQKWYFEYYLPSEIYICKKGFDVEHYSKTHNGLNRQEDFWLKDGYLVVNFQIETIVNGKRRLSYTNTENAQNGYCNMWKLEGYSYQKRDKNGELYNFKDNDTLIYSLKSSAVNDYFIGGTH